MLNWAQARDYCENAHYRLAAVLTPEDQAAVTSLITSANASANVPTVTAEGLWIGGTALAEPASFDGTDEGVGRTSGNVTLNMNAWNMAIWHPEAHLGTFADMSYLNWAAGEPSGGDKFCLKVMQAPEALEAYEWKGANCTSQLAFVCEDARAPSPPSYPPLATLPAPAVDTIASLAMNLNVGDDEARVDLFLLIILLGVLLLLLCCLLWCIIWWCCYRRKQKEKETVIVINDETKEEASAPAAEPPTPGMPPGYSPMPGWRDPTPPADPMPYFTGENEPEPAPPPAPLPEDGPNGTRYMNRAEFAEFLQTHKMPPPRPPPGKGFDEMKSPTKP